MNSKPFECSDMKKTRVSTGLFQTGTIWNNPRTTLFVLEDVFQSSQLQNITVFLCTLYKMKKFRFYPLSCAHDRVFLNSPRRSPKPKKLPKDRGVYADLIPALGAFRVQNLNQAATTTPPRSRLQSYDIHIFIIVLKDVSTCILKALFHSMTMALLIEHARTFLYMQ